MPFFIKGKRKHQSSFGSKGKNSTKKGPNKVRLGSKKKDRENDKDDDDEELDSDLEEQAELQNDFKYSSESEIEETVQEKRLRIANKYLEEVKKQEQDRLETEDVDTDTIAQRLREDVLEQAGKLRKNVADSYSHCGENIVLRCKEHSRSLTCLVISNDNKFIFSASDDFNIVKWSVSDRKKVGVIKRTDKHGHKKKILALAVSSDFQFLASGDKGPTLNIWNPTDLSHVHSFTGHKIDISGLAFRRETHQLFSCSSDKTVKVWNLDEMMYVETLFGHLSGITSMDALARDRAITSGGRDNTVRIWKIPEESHLILNGHKESIDCVRLLNEDQFVTGGDMGNVCLWSAFKKKPVYTLPTAHGVHPENNIPNWVVSVATYLHTDMFASGSFDGVVNIYKCEIKSKSFTKILEAKVEGNINCMSFTTDGLYLVVGVGQEHRIGRWHTKKNVKNSIVLIPLIKKTS